MLRHSPHLHGAPTARKGGASNPKKKGRRGGGGGGAAPAEDVAAAPSPAEEAPHLEDNANPPPDDFKFYRRLYLGVSVVMLALSVFRNWYIEYLVNILAENQSIRGPAMPGAKGESEAEARARMINEWKYGKKKKKKKKTKKMGAPAFVPPSLVDGNLEPPSLVHGD